MDNGARGDRACKKCSMCGICEQACPNLFDIGSGVSQVAKGNYDVIEKIFNLCVDVANVRKNAPHSIS